MCVSFPARYVSYRSAVWSRSGLGLALLLKRRFGKRLLKLVAAACVNNLHEVCSEVLRLKGAATRF